MRLPDTTRIADNKTVADWAAMKARLTNNQDPAVWTEAFNEFFKARLDTRYFAPIKALEDMEKHDGEGFAIVTLQCSLIEFLGSTLEGKTYRYRRKGDPPLDPILEYSDSSMFIKFLESQYPFKGMFSTAGSAQDFYSSVRCGLFHEARTKGRWRIKVQSSAVQAIDTTAKVIHRNKMQTAFDSFVNWYGSKLLKNSSLQQAFIRKFESLCSE